jgi:hypothetical protein
MAEQLEALRPQADFECLMIDIDADEVDRACYHERVPVLEGTEGNLLSEVFLDPTAVLNYLRDV